jgi:hypothetical protein
VPLESSLISVSSFSLPPGAVELLSPNNHRLNKLLEAIQPEADIQGSTANAERNEALGWEHWLRTYLPHYFSRPFTQYQKDFWQDWAWEIEAEQYYRPRVECEPRGVGKSTNAEAAVVSWVARKRRRMIGYVGLDEERAAQHFRTIKAMLESDKLVLDYPHCKPDVQKIRSMATQWSRDAIVTANKAMIVPVTLLGSRRGWKSSDGKRFDALILDDIDKLGQSPELRTKLLDLLKSEILAAGDDNTLVLMPQNLIHRDSVCAQLLDHRADILSDRDFRGPYPLLKAYDAIKEEMPDGSRRWVILSGEAFDPAISIEYSQKLLNKFGKATFERECQQDVNKVEADKDFREYDEVFHIITWEEFEAYFSRYDYDLRTNSGRRKLPERWHKGKGLDWGTSRAHPSAAVFATRPDQTSPLSDCHFVFGEVVLPEYPCDLSEEPELVSPGRVARAIREFEREWNLTEDSFEMALMSHEASAALNTFLVDLPDETKTYFTKWKAVRGSGVPQIQNLLEIDQKRPHPFRRYPSGHPQDGEALTGRPRMYFVVDKAEGELFVDDIGKLRVVGPKSSKGLARLRYELPLYQQSNLGKNKKEDDATDALRGLFNLFGASSGEKTKDEKVEEAIDPALRWEQIESGQRKLTPGFEMSRAHALARATEEIEQAEESDFERMWRGTV